MKLFDVFEAIMGGEMFESEYVSAPHWRPDTIHGVLTEATRAVSGVSGDDLLDVEVSGVRIAKPRHYVNGVEVPCPFEVDKPPRLLEFVWVIDPRQEDGVNQIQWNVGMLNQRLLRHGLVYRTREDAIERFKMMVHLN